MTARRLILASVALALIGSSSTAAFAGGSDSETQNKRVCVVGTSDPSTGQWDGICVSVPVP